LRRVHRVSQQFIVELGVIERDIPDEGAGSAARAHLTRPCFLRFQWLEAARGRRQRRKVRRLYGLRDVAVNLYAIRVLPEHADARREPVVVLACRHDDSTGGVALIITLGLAIGATTDDRDLVGYEEAAFGKVRRGLLRSVCSRQSACLSSPAGSPTDWRRDRRFGRKHRRTGRPAAP
jgi:hypothetical protein